MPANSLARSRQDVAPKRHGESPLRVYGLDLGPTGLVPPQPPGWAHLVSIRSGVAMLRCDGRQSLLSPEFAMWVPAGIPYALDLRMRCRLRIVFCAADLHPERRFGSVTMNALLHELIGRAMACGYLDPSRVRDARLLAVMNDELAALADAKGAPALAVPRDAALLAAIERVLAAPEDAPSIAALAQAAGFSPRTFERRFMRETGLTPREWLRRARLITALVALASGASVTEAGLACGYSSISAFIAAYRAMFGRTPGRRAF